MDLSCIDATGWFNKIPPMPSDEGMIYLLKESLKDGDSIQDCIRRGTHESNIYKDEWIDFFKRHGYIKQ